jgi:hypothetical protein
MSTNDTPQTELPFERITKEPTAVFVDINPKIAEAMLEFNTNNRTLRRHRVSVLAAEMERKQWLTTGEAIKFDVKGRLIDGQHRLEGCIAARMTLHSQLVVTGLPEKSFAVLDTGMKRTPKDTLTVAGIANGSSIAPVARLVQLVQAGLDPYDTSSGKLVTRLDILKFARENLTELDWANRLSRTVYNTAGIGNQTALIALAVMAIEQGHSQPKVEEFFTALASGEKLAATSPILALRTWMIKTGRDIQRYAAATHYCNYVVAFNAWTSGKIVRRHSSIAREQGVPALAPA